MGGKITTYSRVGLVVKDGGGLWVEDNIFLKAIYLGSIANSRSTITIDVPQELAAKVLWEGRETGTKAAFAVFCRELGIRRVKPTKVIFRAPATIVYWNNSTKTVVKCDDRDTYSKEAGLALCYMKKMLGSSRAFNDVLKEWCSDD